MEPMISIANNAGDAGQILKPATPRGEFRPDGRAENLPPPKLSIVTVVYNGAGSLRRTMDSVLICRLLPIEYIVIDGGSTDGTVALLREYEAQLSLWLSEPDRGIYDAMNKALALCRGEYVYFLNCGDWLCPQPALAQAIHLLDLKPCLLMARVNAIDEEGETRLFPRQFGLATARQKFATAYCHQAAFVRTSSMRDVGFDSRFPNFADFAALMRVSETGGQVIECNLVVANFPLDGVSSDWRKAHTLFLEREKVFSELGEPASSLSIFLGSLRAHAYRLKRALMHRRSRR